MKKQSTLCLAPSALSLSALANGIFGSFFVNRSSARFYLSPLHASVHQTQTPLTKVLELTSVGLFEYQ
ncbi:hypothetical protein [Candidatus Bathycorpusculum sp.]|uniref:hypothetical protein n=1 Tax=Candidatus Bathycorpusculum sp. TaxID=2994959 RepID=UPI00283A750E|nr:hypothetical protein [Candidatus Termitimicrobium sp.]MCL2432198.1 hypothetical protein [Candidatus Termitimicrobium sp.]